MTSKTAQIWIDIRHPITNKLIGRLCRETLQLEVVDQKKRAVISLLKPVK